MTSKKVAVDESDTYNEGHQKIKGQLLQFEGGLIQACTGTGQNQGTKSETEAKLRMEEICLYACLKWSQLLEEREGEKERERKYLLAIMAVFPKGTMPINAGDQTTQIQIQNKSTHRK